ncbi:hypothetical protein F53441_6387 [Fusarium austroafricanum]|uniref:PD-(D/E)XK nuclease-like domain-containing protein n=1 Tax=Fusarium austroafricanum TaxID=2364996 RepID=A0A8H4KG05_9HYPO|nr:hypothetical protein F53441_6387 [Fusarium austroafricanum]
MRMSGTSDPHLRLLPKRDREDDDQDMDNDNGGSPPTASKSGTSFRSISPRKRSSPSRTSVASSSPSRKLHSLSLNANGCESRQLGMGDERHPKALRDILKRVNRASRWKGVLNSSLREEFSDLAEYGLDEDDAFSDQGSALPRSFVAQIMEHARKCHEKYHSEFVWNFEVHFCLEKIFRVGEQPHLVDFTPYQSAPITRTYLPPSAGSELVDFCIYLNPLADSAEYETKANSLRTSLPMLCLNHTSYLGLKAEPISISIETKRSGDTEDNEILQMGTWQAAHERELVTGLFKMMQMMSLHTFDRTYASNLASNIHLSPLLSPEALRRVAWSVFFLDSITDGGRYGFHVVDEQTFRLQLPCEQARILGDETVVTEPLMNDPLNSLNTGLNDVERAPLDLSAYLLRTAAARRRALHFAFRVSHQEQMVDQLSVELNTLENDIEAVIKALPKRFRFSTDNMFMHRDRLMRKNRISHAEPIAGLVSQASWAKHVEAIYRLLRCDLMYLLSDTDSTAFSPDQLVGQGAAEYDFRDFLWAKLERLRRGASATTNVARDEALLEYNEGIDTAALSALTSPRLDAMHIQGPFSRVQSDDPQLSGPSGHLEIPETQDFNRIAQDQITTPWMGFTGGENDNKGMPLEWLWLLGGETL